jgi:hypothetical protein
MCMACDGDIIERNWRLVEIISTGIMPDGHTADDLRAMGLPQPGELIRERQPDGTILIKQLPPKKSADFVCDSPVHE